MPSRKSCTSPETRMTEWPSPEIESGSFQNHGLHLYNTTTRCNPFTNSLLPLELHTHTYTKKETTLCVVVYIATPPQNLQLIGAAKQSWWPRAFFRNIFRNRMYCIRIFCSLSPSPPLLYLAVLWQKTSRKERRKRQVPSKCDESDRRTRQPRNVRVPAGNEHIPSTPQ